MIFQSSAYLTIDDSPSDHMDDLTSWLHDKGIPAIFYCRGDMIEENPMAAVRAVQKGFVLANHTHSHERSSNHDVQWIIDDIRQCEYLLGRIYTEAKTAQPYKAFRFPHIDRGTGGWVVDYDTYNDEDRAALLTAYAEGLNVSSMEKPDADAWAKKAALQSWLHSNGYMQPFKGVTHSWFANGEVGESADSLYTYSNCDWMVTARHQGKWPYKTVDDLKNRAKSDKWLTTPGSVNVILAHDQAEIVDITIDLIDDLLENGLKFLEV